MALETLDARALHLALLALLGRLLHERFPLGLPRLHGAFGLGVRRRRGIARLHEFRDPWHERVECRAQCFEALAVGVKMRTGVGVGAIKLFLFAHQPRMGFARVLDGLFEARDLGASGIVLALHDVEMFVGLGLARAQLLDPGLDRALPRERGIERGLVLRQHQVLLLKPGVQFLPAQRQQLRACVAFFLFQFLVARRGTRLLVQFSDLGLEFAANVGDPRQVLACVLDASFGFLAPFLVTRDAGGLFDEATQVFRLGLDDARDHALLDDGVGARAETGAEEQVGDVLAPATGLVEEVIRLAVAPGLAAD